MPEFHQWLAQKFREWEKEQGKSQSYYAFARFLGVSQSDLALWMTGDRLPDADDLALIAEKLGREVYTVMDKPQADPFLQKLVEAFPALPAGLRERLASAAWDTRQYIQSRGLDPESVEAKKALVEIFQRYGIRFGG